VLIFQNIPVQTDLGRRKVGKMMDILLVEDNRSFREMVKEHLGERFPLVDIAEAGNGGEALAKVNSSPPKLIFMDINLPGELGLSLTEKIKARYSEITIAILTNYDLPEYREGAFLSGADYFFNKSSFPWEKIIELVQTVCFNAPGSPSH
jgi:two-component system, NarL family, response regulator DegU